MDTNDLRDALQRLRAEAQAAEPAATVLIRRAARELGGEVVRFETRFKSEASIVAKLERFRRRRPPLYDLDKFNDALRYTLVMDEPVYWPGCLAAVQMLNTDSYHVETEALGWRGNYAGLNLTVIDPRGRRFEVQLHTLASLEFAEVSHPEYEAWRALDRGSARARFLRRALNAAAGQVPLPPGVPRL